MCFLGLQKTASGEQPTGPQSQVLDGCELFKAARVPIIKGNILRGGSTGEGWGAARLTSDILLCGPRAQQPGQHLHMETHTHRHTQIYVGTYRHMRKHEPTQTYGNTQTHVLLQGCVGRDPPCAARAVLYRSAANRYCCGFQWGQERGAWGVP